MQMHNFVRDELEFFGFFFCSLPPLHLFETMEAQAAPGAMASERELWGPELKTICQYEDAGKGACQFSGTFDCAEFLDPSTCMYVYEQEHVETEGLHKGFYWEKDCAEYCSNNMLNAGNGHSANQVCIGYSQGTSYSGSSVYVSCKLYWSDDGRNVSGNGQDWGIGVDMPSCMKKTVCYQETRAPTTSPTPAPIEADSSFAVSSFVQMSIVAALVLSVMMCGCRYVKFKSLRANQAQKSGVQMGGMGAMFGQRREQPQSAGGYGQGGNTMGGMGGMFGARQQQQPQQQQPQFQQQHWSAPPPMAYATPVYEQPGAPAFATAAPVYNANAGFNSSFDGSKGYT
jgi:hypothetical protein